MKAPQYKCYTSIDVETFFSLILSYFCFLFPALSPCQGRLKKDLKNMSTLLIDQPVIICGKGMMIITCLLKSTSAHIQEILNHLFCFVLNQQNKLKGMRYIENTKSVCWQRSMHWHKGNGKYLFQGEYSYSHI